MATEKDPLLPKHEDAGASSSWLKGNNAFYNASFIVIVSVIAVAAFLTSVRQHFHTTGAGDFSPKVLHVIWVTPGLEGDGYVPGEFQGNIARWRQLNPDWQIRTWTNRDVKAEPSFNEFTSYLQSQPNFPGALVADILRYAILGRFGGLYADLDIYPTRGLRDRNILGSMGGAAIFACACEAGDPPHPTQTDMCARPPGGYRTGTGAVWPHADAKCTNINNAFMGAASDGARAFFTQMAHTALEGAKSVTCTGQSDGQCDKAWMGLTGPPFLIHQIGPAVDSGKLPDGSDAYFVYPGVFDLDCRRHTCGGDRNSQPINDANVFGIHDYMCTYCPGKAPITGSAP